MSRNTDVQCKNKVKRSINKPEVNYKLNTKSDYKNINAMHALLLGIVSSIDLNFYINSLTTGWKKDRARKKLKSEWQIKDAPSVHQTIDYILNEGDRTTYNILLPHFLSSTDKEGRKMRLKEKFLAIELLINYSDNLSDYLDFINGQSTWVINEADLNKGILAWDMCQIVITSRLAYDAGYLNEKEAWKYLLLAYEICRNEYHSWEEISKSIYIGGAMKTGKKKWFIN